MTNELEKLYQDAKSALSEKDYDSASELLQKILVVDHDYKDAAHLLAKAVKLKRRRWYNDPRLWGTVGVLILIGILVWLVPKIPIPATTFVESASNPTATLEPTATQVPTVTLMPTPTSIPLIWKRISLGLEFSRDETTEIIIDPIDEDIIYASMSQAGVYKSINGGNSWQPANHGLDSTNIRTLVMDPDNHKTLLAADADGVYKTVDGAETWQSSDKNINFPNWNLNTVQLIYTPEQQGDIYFNAQFVLYHSEDNGDSWQRIWQQGASHIEQFNNFAVDPKNPNNLIAVQENASPYPSGVYISRDQGKSWEHVDSIAGPMLRNKDMLMDGGRIYISTEEALYRSTDNLESWDRLTDFECAPLALNPHQGNSILCNRNHELFQVQDDGNSWSLLSVAFERENLAIFSHEPERILLGSLGLYLSLDGGKNWMEHDNGLGSGRFELILAPDDPSTLYAYEYDQNCDDRNSRVLRSTNTGANWEIITDEGCGLWLASGDDLIYRMQHEYSTVYALLVSDNEGQSWQSIRLDISKLETLALHPNKQGVIFAVGDIRNDPDNSLLTIPTILYSNDYGTSWLSAKGISSQPNYALQLSRMFFDHQEGNRAYLIPEIGNNGFYSTNAGESWQRCGAMNAAQPSMSDTRLAVHPLDKKTLVLATRGTGVWSSSDGCNTWTRINIGLENLYVNSVAYDPENPSVLYAGTDGGAFVSYNEGGTWHEVSDGLLGAIVIYSIAVDDNSNVYATTPYGIFQLEDK